MSLEIIVFVAYLLIMLAIGLFYYRSNKTNADYVLGGRKLNVWTTAMSAQASDMSGWLLMGLPGLALVFVAGKDGAATLSYTGLYEAIWTAIGLAIGTYLNWLIVAKRLRKFTQVYDDSITLPDFFEKRFGDKGGAIRIISAIFILIFFAVYAAAQFAAGAKLFNVVFNLDYQSALWIGAAVIVGYTFLGGFMAVCATDLIQGIIMFVALVLVPYTAFMQIGGVSGYTSLMQSVQSTMHVDTISGVAGGTMIASALAWGLGYFGQPHILTRFMGIRSSKEIRPARVIAMIWVLITLFCAVVVGLLATAYATKFGNIDLHAIDSENIFIFLTKAIFTTEALGAIAGPILVGIFLTAVLAAIMSTADSQLLVASSAFSQDIFTKFVKGKSDNLYMWISRATVIVLSLVAVFIARDPDSSVFRIVQNAWAGFGAAFGPLILFSLFWRRTTKEGALVGIVSGGLIALLWKSVFAGTALGTVYSLLPGFIISSILIVVVSLCTKKPSRQIIDKYNAALKSDI